MKLHTREQAPKEGNAKEVSPQQAPVVKWKPDRSNYLQFLVDSRHVYATFENIIQEEPLLEPFRSSGLERASVLDQDVAWFVQEGEKEPPVASQGLNYATHVSLSPLFLLLSQLIVTCAIHRVLY